MIHLGLTPAEIGDLTPRQFNALWKAWKVREQASDQRAAIMPWVYANANRGDKVQPFKLSDFMPSASKAVKSAEDQVAEDYMAMESFVLLHDALAKQKRGG